MSESERGMHGEALVKSETEQTAGSYYGIAYSEWAMLPSQEGFVLNKSKIVDPHGKVYPIGEAKVTWTPRKQYTKDTEIVSGAIGGLAVMHAVVAEEIKKKGTLTRRGFLRASLAGATGATIGHKTLPLAAENAVHHTDTGKNNPAYAIQALAHPLNVKAHYEAVVTEPTDMRISPEVDTVYSSDAYTIEARTLEHSLGKDTIHVLRPGVASDVSLSLHTAAGLPSQSGTVTIGADLTEYAKGITQRQEDSYTIYGLLKKPYVANVRGRTFKESHTIPSAIALHVDGDPVAVTSASWTHPFAISHSDTAEISVDTLPAWVGFASKTGVLAPDFLQHWGKDTSIAQMRQYLPLLKEKFTADGWTEAMAGHQAHHRVLTFLEGKLGVMGDVEAWAEIENAILHNPSLLEQKAYVKPGSIIDLQEDTPMNERGGGIENAMALNGYLLDENSELRSIVTMNQDTRMQAAELIRLLKDLDSEARYYVGTDEHGGGGILHVPEVK